MIVERIQQLRDDLGLPVDPARRGPVLLERFFEELGVTHRVIPNMTLGAVLADLARDGIYPENVGDPQEPLAGLLFRSGESCRAFVNASDILPRQRFTAAHELGHAVLHRDQMETFLPDHMISEADEPTQQHEREANLFAAELLMPRELLQARAAELRSTHGVCPRLVLAYRLASELLVSREAMRYRLKYLGLGDESS